MASLLVASLALASACDLQGTKDCPAIGGSGGSEDVEDHPEYAAAAATFSGTADVLEALEPGADAGQMRIRVVEVESIEVWHSYSCDNGDSDEVVDLGVANVQAEVTSPDGSLTLVLPATVSDADTDDAALFFDDWSSTDPDVLARVPDTDLADDAEIGLVELEVTDAGASLVRTDMVLCTMVEGCSNTTRHVLFRWANDGA